MKPILILTFFIILNILSLYKYENTTKREGPRPKNPGKYIDESFFYSKANYDNTKEKDPESKQRKPRLSKRSNIYKAGSFYQWLVNKYGEENADEVVTGKITNIEDFKKMMEHFYEVTGQTDKSKGKSIKFDSYNSTENEDLKGKHFHNNTGFADKYAKHKHADKTKEKGIGITIIDDIKKIGSYIGEGAKLFEEKFEEGFEEVVHIIPEAINKVKNFTLKYLEDTDTKIDEYDDEENATNVAGKHRHRGSKEDILGIHIHDFGTKTKTDTQTHKHNDPKEDLLGFETDYEIKKGKSAKKEKGEVKVDH